MFKKTAIITTLFLTACGGGGGGGSSILNDNFMSSSSKTSTQPAVITNTSKSLEIIGSSQLQTIDKVDASSLSISGNSNVIAIKSNITTLDIVGDSNEIDLAKVVRVEKCMVLGNSNKLTKVDAAPIQCDITGLSNKGFNQ